MRNALGQFVAGHTVNAGGRPKDEHKGAALARTCTLEAIETLVELRRSGQSERIRLVQPHTHFWIGDGVNCKTGNYR